MILLVQIMKLWRVKAMKKYVIFNSCDVLINEYETEEEAEKALEKLEKSEEWESYRIEERKVYKIYAQCCRAVHPIQEVDEKTAINDTWTNAESYFSQNYIIDAPEDIFGTVWDEVGGMLDNKIIEQWNKYSFLECGDYVFKYCTFTEVSRPSAGGELDASIFEEIQHKIENKYNI